MNIEKIEAFLQQEGINKQELVREWAKRGLVDLSAIEQKSAPLYTPIMQFSRIKPGMFYHVDGNISTEFVGDDCIAMIAAVYHQERTAVALLLNSQELPFSSDGLVVDTRGLDGQSATRLICQKAQETGLKAEAAQYCRNFSCRGVPENTAFLLSEAELRNMFAYVFNVREAYATCGLSLRYLLTSSCDEDSKEVKIGMFSNISVITEQVELAMPVCPAIKIDLQHLN